MQIGMRQVSSETAGWFGTACKGGDLTRTALARGPFGRENWHGRVGKPCLASARRMLPTLAERLGARLPEAEATAPGPHVRPVPDFPDSSVARPLGGPGALPPGPVTDAEDRRREAMAGIRHPEGWRRPPGGQVRCWIRSERCGAPGGIGLSAAGIRPGPRDGFIGRVVRGNRSVPLSGVRARASRPGPSAWRRPSRGRRCPA